MYFVSVWFHFGWNFFSQKKSYLLVVKKSKLPKPCPCAYRYQFVKMYPIRRINNYYYYIIYSLILVDFLKTQIRKKIYQRQSFLINRSNFQNTRQIVHSFGWIFLNFPIGWLSWVVANQSPPKFKKKVCQKYDEFFENTSHF